MIFSTYSKFKNTASLALLVGALACSTAARSAMFDFSFDNEDGAVAGTVSGTIILPDGDGTGLAATSVIVDFAPAALEFAVGFDFTSFVTTENDFTVVGGVIDVGASHFVGLFNGSTALAFFFPDGSTFLDSLDAQDLGATGVLDSDSSTLTMSSSGTVPEPSSIALLALGAVGFAGIAHRRTRANRSTLVV